MKIPALLFKFHVWLFVVGTLLALFCFGLGCDLFSEEREIRLRLPDENIYGEFGPHPIGFRVEVTSASGGFNQFSKNVGVEISLKLQEGVPQVILVYPIFENPLFKVKPKGVFFLSGVTGEENLFFEGECGAALIPLAELFRYDVSLPGFNCYRFSKLFYNRSAISPFAFDFACIKTDIVREEFSTFSLRKMNEYAISISGIPQGEYFPSDPFLKSVIVESGEVFTTNLYVGMHQYLNGLTGEILELSCKENGVIVFFIIENL